MKQFIHIDLLKKEGKQGVLLDCAGDVKELSHAVYQAMKGNEVFEFVVRQAVGFKDHQDRKKKIQQN